MVAAGTITPWYGLPQQDDRGILQYAAGAYVTYNGHLYRAIQDITKATANATVPVPVAGPLWEQESAVADTPAIIATGGAGVAFNGGANQFAIQELIGSPLYHRNLSQAFGGTEVIELSSRGTAETTARRDAWNTFVSTSSLAIEVGTRTYPADAQPSIRPQVTVDWPTIALEGDDQSPIITQATLDPQLNSNGIDIFPSSVTIGGELGAFTFRPEVNSITAGDPVGAGTIIGDVVSYTGTRIEIPPVGNLEPDTAYVVRITQSDITGLPAGDYLAQAIFATDAAGNPTGDVQLRDLRAVVDGFARDPINPLTPGTSTNVALTVHEFTSTLEALDLLDRNGDLVLSVSAANDVVDFTNVPTVAGSPLLERYVATSNVPPQPEDLVADQTYTISVTNHTSTDLVTPVRLTIDGLSPIQSNINRGVPSGQTAEFTFSLNALMITNIRNNFRGRPALDILMRFGDIHINVQDNVGGGGHAVSYRFNDGINGTFEVVPSDGSSYTVNTGVITQASAGQFDNGNIVTWSDDGTQLSGDNFTDLLSLNFIMVDSDFPLRATQVEANTTYTFRVYTRQVSYTPQTGPDAPTDDDGNLLFPNLGPDNFQIRIAAGQVTAEAANFSGPTAIANNSANEWTLSLTEAQVTALSNAAALDEILRPTFDAEGVGEFVAVHDASMTVGGVLGSGTAGQLVQWASSNTVIGIDSPVPALEASIATNAGGITTNATNIADNHSEVLSENKRVDELENRIVALQNEVHGLEEGGTGQRLDTNEFRTATIRGTTIDELVQYTPQGGLPVQVQFNLLNY